MLIKDTLNKGHRQLCTCSVMRWNLNIMDTLRQVIIERLPSFRGTNLNIIDTLREIILSIYREVVLFAKMYYH